MSSHGPQAGSSSPGQDLRRGQYYIPQGDLHFLAGRTRFRVHSYFFTRESEYWKKLLKPQVSPGDDKKLPGSHERNPFNVNETAEDFAYFLWVFYNEDYGVYNTSLDRWIAILRLATKWEFPNIRSFAIEHIDKMPMETAKKVKLYQDYSVPRAYLLPLYIKLVTREEMLEPEEFEILDKKTLHSVTKARELLRAPVVRPSINTLLSPVRSGANEEERANAIATAFEMSPQEIRTFQPSAVSPTNTLDPQPVAIN